MRASLALMALFFFAASLLQYQAIYRGISEQPKTRFDAVTRHQGVQTALESETARFHTMVALEQDIVAFRYNQANAVLLLRMWTRYMGFLVGMVLALTGAFFILGRLREDSTHLAAESGSAKLDLTTQSPGIVLSILGTLLMFLTIWVKLDVEMTDKPVYIAPWGLERVRVEQTPPREIPGEAAGITPSSDEGRPVPPLKAEAAPCGR
jgi:hypothetical protein